VGGATVVAGAVVAGRAVVVRAGGGCASWRTRLVLVPVVGRTAGRSAAPVLRAQSRPFVRGRFR
jgi:hypothetical protein